MTLAVAFKPRLKMDYDYFVALATSETSSVAMLLNGEPSFTAGLLPRTTPEKIL